MNIIAPLLVFVLGVNCAVRAIVVPGISANNALAQYELLKNIALFWGVDVEKLFASALQQHVGISLKVGSADVGWNKTYGSYNTRHGRSVATGFKIKFSDCTAGRGTGNLYADIAINWIKAFFGGHSEIKITAVNGNILRNFESFQSSSVVTPDPNAFLIGKGFAEGKRGGGGIGLGNGTIVTSTNFTANGIGFGVALGSAAGNGTGPATDALAEFIKVVVSRQLRFNACFE